MTVVPHRGDMHTASCEDVTPRSSLLRTHSPIPDGSSILRPWPRARSLCRLLPVPAANGIFPTLSLQIFPRMPGPLARRYREVLLPVSSSASSAFPNRGVGRLPATTREIRLLAEAFFVAADISLCSSLRVCSPPRSFLPLRTSPQSSRGFYIRAEHALLPQHAPDMLTVRIQAIDGVGTYTLLDSQPCRLLPNHSTDRYTDSQLVWKMVAVSRQLSRRAQRARKPIIAVVNGRLPSLHGICSTTIPDRKSVV